MELALRNRTFPLLSPLLSWITSIPETFSYAKSCTPASPPHFRASYHNLLARDLPSQLIEPQQRPPFQGLAACSLGADATRTSPATSSPSIVLSFSVAPTAPASARADRSAVA
jgi:hypothetical protein